MSRRLVFDLIPLSIHFPYHGNKRIPLFDLMLPADSKLDRKLAIINILAWIRDLRRWFAEPGPILPKLGHFLDNLAWPAFRHIRLRPFDEIGDELITKEECDTYCLCISNFSEEESTVSLSRDISNEEFSTQLALNLMM